MENQSGVWWLLTSSWDSWLNWLGSLVKLYPISLHIGMEISSHCPGSPAAVLMSRRMDRMDRDTFMVRLTRHQLQFIVCLLATGPDCAGRTASSEPASSECHLLSSPTQPATADVSLVSQLSPVSLLSLLLQSSVSCRHATVQVSSSNVRGMQKFPG